MPTFDLIVPELATQIVLSADWANSYRFVADLDPHEVQRVQELAGENLPAMGGLALVTQAELETPRNDASMLRFAGNQLVGAGRWGEWHDLAIEKGEGEGHLVTLGVEASEPIIAAGLYDRFAAIRNNLEAARAKQEAAQAIVEEGAQLTARNFEIFARNLVNARNPNRTLQDTIGSLQDSIGAFGDSLGFLRHLGGGDQTTPPEAQSAEPQKPDNAEQREQATRLRPVILTPHNR